MIAPIDFIREKYIEPNKITQDAICDALQLGKKTVSELYQKKRGFTIHTAKKFGLFFGLKPEFILMKQVEYDLFLDKEEYQFIKPYLEMSTEEKKLSLAKWILATINNSISDQRLHYDFKDLDTIFQEVNTNMQYQYAITTIFKEVNYEDIVKYCELWNIKKANLRKLYQFYLTQYNAKVIAQYEWLLEEF
ncbi:MAG: hypothetical protein PHF17_11415 [Arcobacteraceae bacterium]|nr:hypothetical protein [Arcobacteraceae bacterium]